MHIGEPPSPSELGEPSADRPVWRVPEAAHRAGRVVWGAHGGAGTTTLAIWLLPAWDLGTAQPAMHPRYPAAIAAGRPLILHCRCTAWSARAATIAVAAVTRAGGQVTVLAAVSGGWPEPCAAPARFGLLEPQHQLACRGDGSVTLAPAPTLSRLSSVEWPLRAV